MMTKLIITLIVLANFSITANATDFYATTARKFNKITGAINVTMHAWSDSKDIIPLSDEVEKILEGLEFGTCIKITGSYSGETVFARAIKTCN
jgi:hypothetical protein